MKEYVCSIDLGTSWIKVALFDFNGNYKYFQNNQEISLLAAAEVPRSENPYEFEADEYFTLVCHLIKNLIEKFQIEPNHIKAICCSSQRASIVLVDKNDQALKGLSWQDTRSSKDLKNFFKNFDSDYYYHITALPPSTLWSFAKILWLKETQSELFKATSKIVLLQDYILHRLGAKNYLTDFSNASLTGLFDISKLNWSSEILSALKLKKETLPEIEKATSIVGRINSDAFLKTGLSRDTFLILGGGDQQCAALGIGAIQAGQASLCLGTAAILSCPVNQPIFNLERKFFCTAHLVPDRWVIEGIQNSFGSSLNWIKTILGKKTLENYLKVEERNSKNSEELFFLPFLAGIGTPDFVSSIRGSFINIDLAQDGYDLVKAVIYGICFEMGRIFESIEKHLKINQVLVAGGGSSYKIITQTLANILQKDLWISSVSEASLLGAAILAWTGLNKFKNINEGSAKCFPKFEKFYKIDNNILQIQKSFDLYKNIVDKYLSFNESLNFPEKENH